MEDLVLWQMTKTIQKLPADLDKIRNSHKNAMRQMKQYDITQGHITNKYEIPYFFICLAIKMLMPK